MKISSVTIPAGPGEWDLNRLHQVVGEHKLERGRLEFKRELGNGNSTLEAIAALANTFGGVVLIGVDEDKAGLGRIVGVAAAERDRLARMCWDRLVPPFSPDIIPIELGGNGKYVLAVLIDPGYVRRPVMLTQGNKILVRIEGHSVPADWYRLRDLFSEQPDSATAPVLPASGGFVPSPGFAHPDLGIRGRLVVTGPRGHSDYITEAARGAILGTLNSNDAPVTGITSGVSDLMHTWSGGNWHSRYWQLYGPASTRLVNAEWHGLATGGQGLTEARLGLELIPGQSQSDNLLITLETLVTNPRRAAEGDQIKANLGNAEEPFSSYLVELAPTPFLALVDLGRLMFGIFATLWGPLGAQVSNTVLGQPLGPPAQLDLAVFTVAQSMPSHIPLSDCVNFGTARLIPGNTPLPWTDLGPIQPDQHLFSRTEQEQVIHGWLVRLGVHNGYQDIEQEIARTQRLPDRPDRTALRTLRQSPGSRSRRASARLGQARDRRAWSGAGLPGSH